MEAIVCTHSALEVYFLCSLIFDVRTGFVWGTVLLSGQEWREDRTRAIGRGPESAMANLQTHRFVLQEQTSYQNFYFGSLPYIPSSLEKRIHNVGKVLSRCRSISTTYSRGKRKPLIKSNGFA
jgi:hypothetical protein